MARVDREESLMSRNRRYTSPATTRPQPPQSLLRQATSESDDSASSPERTPDDDTDFFMAQANDSQSSLGVTNLRDMSMSGDLEQLHRESPISKLPPELLISIFVKLNSTADLRNCMLVSYNWAVHCVGVLWHRPQCNVWKNVINVTASLSQNSFFRYHELVKRLNLATLHEKVNDGTIQPFMQCKRIERLTLTNCSKLTDSGLAGLVEGNKHLQALDVTDIRSLTDHTLLAVATHCPRLQGLNVSNCSKITDESLVVVARNCRQVKRLKLNNLPVITEASVIAFAENCPSILEIDLHSCTQISSESVTALLSCLYYLRELRLAHCVGISDAAFLNLQPKVNFEYLRILDLTGCENVQDDAVCRIIPATPKLRNLVLAKCRHLTDRAAAAISRLGKTLHYIHLGHCANLTDQAIIGLVKSCNRIRYIDLACCNRLTDQSVQHLAQLPKLRRIGLVKCQQLTDQSILALARGAMSSVPPLSRPGCLERVHLSYCVSLTLQGVHELLQYCPRLTHLSLTGVQAFLRKDLTRFCREAPTEFTQVQRDVFCVFSGEGVSRLREHLKRLAEDHEREGRLSRNESLISSEPEGDSGRETPSDDGTIDGPEEGMAGQATLPPRSADHRSYAQVVSGSGSNLFHQEDAGDAGPSGIASSPHPSSGMVESMFAPGFHGQPSHIEGGAGPSFQDHVNGLQQGRMIRRMSEGQRSGSRPTLIDSEPPALDDYCPSVPAAGSQRPLPPRPHWPSPAPLVRPLDAGGHEAGPPWGESLVAPSRYTDLTTITGPRRAGDSVHRLQGTAERAIDDTDDDDGEMVIR